MILRLFEGLLLLGSRSPGSLQEAPSQRRKKTRRRRRPQAVGALGHPRQRAPGPRGADLHRRGDGALLALPAHGPAASFSSSFLTPGGGGVRPEAGIDSCLPMEADSWAKS